jgi:hypothetical protein
MVNLRLILLLLALILFVLAALDVKARVNLTAAGLALLTVVAMLR